MTTLSNTPYTNYGPSWIHPAILTATIAGALPEVGIESDRKRRGTAINLDIVAADEALGAALVQVRETHFRPNRFSSVKKDYFVLRTDGTIKPVRAMATTPLALAIKRAA